MTSERDQEWENWEVSVRSPNHLEMEPPEENHRLTPRDTGPGLHSSVSTINMDECWTINIKAPASLTVEKGPVDENGFMETVICECAEDRGRFLCGPEWKVRITTKADQHLDIQQIQDGDEFRVLITPRPPSIEEDKKIEVKEEVVKTVKKKEEKKKVVKVEVKTRGIDTRYLRSGGKIFFKECPLYHKAHPWVMPLGLS